MRRDVMRRLSRLEARAIMKETTRSVSFTIRFVSPGKGVTKRLLIDGDGHIRTGATVGESGIPEEV